MDTEQSKFYMAAVSLLLFYAVLFLRLSKTCISFPTARNFASLFQFR